MKCKKAKKHKTIRTFNRKSKMGGFLSSIISIDNSGQTSSSSRLVTSQKAKHRTKIFAKNSQEEVLRRYCDLHNIGIRQTIFEDHSTKTFNRPQWQSLLLNLKKKRGQIDLVLFTKWDRSSRNAPDAYQMINTLKMLLVEPQAIEQPLDMEVT